MCSWKGNEPSIGGPQSADVVARLRALEADAQAANEELHLVLSLDPEWLGTAATNVSQVANLCALVIAACDRAVQALAGDPSTGG